MDKETLLEAIELLAELHPDIIPEIENRIRIGMASRFQYEQSMRTKQDRLLRMIELKTDFGSEKNTEESVEVMNANTFNGNDKKYTPNEI